MNPQIRKYDPARDYEGLMKLIESEGEEWQQYLEPAYGKALKDSVVFVALMGNELCGYARALKDGGLYVWVIDLLVQESKRGHAIGKHLLKHIATEFPKLDIFVLSDVDPYYEKLGFKKEGSIFKVT